MRVLLDTNVVLMALPSKSPYHPIMQLFNERKFSLVPTTEIILEYEEILGRKANPLIASSALSAFVEAPNAIATTIHFRWDLITVDPDDNKFTDAYFAASADYLVTKDGHFDVVKHAAFPKASIVTPDEFLGILKFTFP